MPDPAHLLLAALAGALAMAAVWALQRHRTRLTGRHQRSPRGLTDLLGIIGDAGFVHDPGTGEIIDVNAAACVLFGHDRATFLTLQVAAITAPGGGVGQDEAVARMRAARDQGPQIFPWPCRRADGSDFAGEVSLQTTVIEDREYLIAIVRDLDARARQERDLIANEARLRSFLERSPIPIGLSLLDGRIIYRNAAFLAAFGYDAKDVPDVATWFELAYPDPDYRDGIWRDWERDAQAAVSGDGAIAAREVRVRRKDGRYGLFAISGVVAGDQVLAFFVDLTAAKESEAFQAALIDQAADGVCVYHDIPEAPHIHFTIWNRRMIEITGHAIETINRQGWFQTVFTDPTVRQQALDRMARLRRGEHLVDDEWTIQDAAGRCRVLRISTSILATAEGRDHVLCIMRDVSERKQADLERRKLEAQMQQAQKLESLGVLAGGIAHDFNNLLMAVLGRANLAALSLPGESTARGHLEEIERSAQRAADLCRQLLAYAGKGRFVVEVLDLNRMVDEMSRMLEVSIGKKIVLKYEYARQIPAIRADATQIRQVVMNLITNASEAIGERSGYIALRSGSMHCDRRYLNELWLDHDLAEGLYVYLEVADTGCGMDPETRQKLFEPFFTTKFTGRGLGMAAVVGIVRGHRGAIKIYSEPGKGTTVKVLFPAVEERPTVQEAELVDHSQRSDGTVTVLVVDDEETIRSLAADMLQHLGYQALQASDGREAIAVFRANKDTIDAVILDLTMPQMDGEEAYRELRRIDPDLRVILSSGYNQQEVTQRFVGKGVAGFIQKPYNVRALAEVLATVLKG